MSSVAGKRILYIITKSNWGGAQAYVYVLATAYQKAGADVTVACGGTGRPGSETGLLAAKLNQAGIRTLVVPALSRDIGFFQEFRALKELRTVISQERPDILHLNSSKAGGIGALAGRLEKVPCIIFTAHGWAHKEPRPWPMPLVLRFMSWLTVALCDKVIVLAESERRRAPALFFRRKLRVIPIGLDAFPLETRSAARVFLAPLPELVKRPQWILMTAELTRNKGVDLAIHAFAGVAMRFKDTALVVLGEGELHARLEKLIQSYQLQDRVFLLGFVPDAKQYLSAGDIYLMPSRKEGFPFALLEAGLAGMPVVASAVGGIPEIVTDEVSGLLVRRGDIDGIADALTRLLEHPEKAAQFGAALKGTVEKRFTESTMLERTAETYG